MADDNENAAVQSGKSLRSWRYEKVGPNPFRLEVPRMSIPELFLRLLLTMTLMPIRILGMAFGILLILWPAAVFVMSSQDMKEPLSDINRFLMCHCFNPVIRLVYFFAGITWVCVKGKCATPQEAPIIVTAPHSSFFDPGLVWLWTEAASTVTKNDVLDIPIIGKIIASAQPVWIDRTNPDARRVAVEEIKMRAKSDGKWTQIMIFPEGTTSAGQALITFKPGAFLPGVPIQPVVLTLPDYMVWTWDSAGALYVLWRVWTSLWTAVELEFLPVYTPTEEEKTDASLFAQNVQKFIAEKSGRTCSSLGFEDCRLIQAAKNLGLPTEVATIDVVKASQILEINVETIIHELKNFALEASKRPNGRITLTGFGDLLRVPAESASGILVEAFTAFEREQTGLMSFKEFLAFKSLAKKIGDESNVLKIAAMFGDDDEPFDYDDLVAVTKVVAWRRHLDPSKIGPAAEKLKAQVEAFKRRKSDGNQLLSNIHQDKIFQSILNI